MPDSTIAQLRNHYVSSTACGWLEEAAKWLRAGSAHKIRPQPQFGGWASEFESERAKLVLAVAKAQLNFPSSVEAALQDLTSALPETDPWSGPFLRGLEREVRRRAGLHYRPVEPVAEAETAILLVREGVNGAAKGVHARLELKLLPGGSGSVFPAPEMTFVMTDADWTEALETALAGAVAEHGWPVCGTCDMQWRVLLPENCHFEMLGRSAGAAARLAIDHALTKGPRHTLNGVVFVAECGADGSLGGVDFQGLVAKLRDGIHLGLPRPHTLVLSEVHRADILKSLEDGCLDGARVLFARSFSHARAQLIGHLDKAWRHILDAEYTGEWTRHRHLQRRRPLDDALLAQWEHCRAQPHQSGGLCLIADPFFGKSAFASCWFREGRPVLDGFFVAGHFFREGSASLRGVRDALVSLGLQLCQAHGLPVPENLSSSPAQEFTRLLRQAGSKALAAGRWQMIVLDGIDEAESRERALLDDALPVPGSPLPPGCFILLTSRPGGDLSRFGTIPAFKRLPLDPEGRTTTEEVRQILGTLNAGFSEPLESDLLDRLAESCEGLLGLAFFLTIHNDRLAQDAADWRNKRDSMPRGLEGAVVREWNRAMRAADASGRFRPSAVRALLGCLALTGEVTGGQIRALIGAIPDHAWRGSFAKDDLNLRNLPAVLDAARIFFDPVPAGMPDDQVRRRFWHTSFAQFILKQLPVVNRSGLTGPDPFLEPDEVTSLQRVLAAASLVLWQKNGTAADYALRAVCGHVRGAGDMGAEWARLLLEMPEFLFRRVESASTGALFEDFPLEQEARDAGASPGQALALDRIRHVLGRRGHFVNTGQSSAPPEGAS